MSDVETRALGRVAAFLLASSLLRLAVAARGPADTPSGPDALQGLLSESKELAAEEALRSTPLAPGELLDPNRVTAAELDRLPGVGPAIAEAVVRSRESDGPFRGREDLLRVRGIGPALLERMAPHLAFPAVPPRAAERSTPPRPAAPSAPVRPRAPLDLNRADTLALQSLPGVGPARARRIVEARAGEPFRSVEDLLRVRGIGPATLARLKPLVAVSR